MTALRNQRGTALVAVLSLSMILLPLGALVVLQCRTDLSIQHNLRSDIEAFYVAEAGLAHAVAEILPGQSFDRLLAGPDGITGTRDDGVFPFAGGTPAPFPYAPFRYNVQLVLNGNGTLRIISNASGQNGSAKVLETLVVRSPAPFTPAAVYAETATASIDLGAAGFRLSGRDHQVSFPPAPAPAPAAPLPALSTPRADLEPVLRGKLLGTAAGQISGAGAQPSVATAPQLNVTNYANAIADAPAASSRSATSVDAGQFGTRSAPELSIVNGDLSVPGRLTGSGILIVRGALRVAGSVEFSGLVLALGAVQFEPSSSVTVVGTLWQGPSQDERLELRGNGAVVYSSTALAAVDRTFPGLLPHAAVVAGWQEPL
jgi:hypothetical protein